MSTDDERVAVQTYVPASQRETWREEADSQGMSQAEFVRTMVQAGRRGFDLDPDVDEEPGSSAVDPWGNALENRVLEILDADGVVDWDELAETVLDDLEESLEDLQSVGMVRHDGRRGGYEVMDGGG